MSSCKSAIYFVLDHIPLPSSIFIAFAFAITFACAPPLYSEENQKLAPKPASRSQEQDNLKDLGSDECAIVVLFFNASESKGNKYLLERANRHLYETLVAYKDASPNTTPTHHISDHLGTALREVDSDLHLISSYVRRLKLKHDEDDLGEGMANCGFSSIESLQYFESDLKGKYELKQLDANLGVTVNFRLAELKENRDPPGIFAKLDPIEIKVTSIGERIPIPGIRLSVGKPVIVENEKRTVLQLESRTFLSQKLDTEYSVHDAIYVAFGVVK